MKERSAGRGREPDAARYKFGNREFYTMKPEVLLSRIRVVLCRPSHPGNIGAAARAEISEFLGRPAHLFLTVKVRPNWLDEAERYSEMGLDWKDGD